jgi:cyclic pyranopterin phosphate synthase
VEEAAVLNGMKAAVRSREMLDSYGRIIDYLRVSVTDRCNLRCVYCMPPDGVPWKPHDSILKFEEILRLCRIMAELGIKKIKVTGGEPLVRRGTGAFLKNLKTLTGIERVTLTTNGLLLETFLDEAEESSPGSLPDAVNISMDALDEDRFAKITGEANRNPDEILRGIDRLLKIKIPVKINCVLVKGLNEEEILPLTLLTKEKNIAVRFIELMPMGSAANFKHVTGAETSAIIEKEFGVLTPFSGVEGSGPASYYSLKGFAGKIGFIRALSRSFCESCNRIRLTSEGFLKTCLFSELDFDLRTLLRSSASDSELARAIGEAAAQKKVSHNLCGENYPKGMSGIGG